VRPAARVAASGCSPAGSKDASSERSRPACPPHTSEMLSGPHLGSLSLPLESLRQRFQADFVIRDAVPNPKVGVGDTSTIRKELHVTAAHRKKCGDVAVRRKLSGVLQSKEHARDVARGPRASRRQSLRVAQVARRDSQDASQCCTCSGSWPVST
jgi:hypothetical protein